MSKVVVGQQLGEPRSRQRLLAADAERRGHCAIQCERCWQRFQLHICAQQQDQSEECRPPQFLFARRLGQL